MTPMTAISMGECGRPTAVMAEKAFHGQEDAVASAGVHGIDCQHRFATVAAVEMQGLHDQKFATLVRGRLLRRHHIADYTPDKHLAMRVCRSRHTQPETGNVHRIHDGDDGGLGGHFGGKEGKAGLAAAAPVDGFPGAGTDRIESHQGTAFFLRPRRSSGCTKSSFWA